PLPTTSGVSLTAEQITTLLRKDAGFTLYIKKLLVQKAYDQGRFLALQEFGDEDLYRLVREDATIRTIITTEAEQRGYVTVNASASVVMMVRMVASSLTRR